MQSQVECLMNGIRNTLFGDDQLIDGLAKQFPGQFAFVPEIAAGSDSAYGAMVGEDLDVGVSFVLAVHADAAVFTYEAGPAVVGIAKFYLLH